VYLDFVRGLFWGLRPVEAASWGDYSRVGGERGGVRSQESGVRSQEAEERREGTGDARRGTGDGGRGVPAWRLRGGSVGWGWGTGRGGWVGKKNTEYSTQNTGVRRRGRGGARVSIMFCCVPGEVTFLAYVMLKCA
jgi:hypothetical protein